MSMYQQFSEIKV